MKKVIAIFLIFSFMVSLFDILDVDDVKLGDKEIFSTMDEHANNEYDDINDDGFQYSTVHIFILSYFHDGLIFLPVSTVNYRPHQDSKLSYSIFYNNLYRPPIA